jgi:hypothetical protein
MPRTIRLAPSYLGLLSPPVPVLADFSGRGQQDATAGTEPSALVAPGLGALLVSCASLMMQLPVGE